MPAHKLVSEQQLEMLVEYMEEHKDFAVGRLLNSGPLAKQQALHLWEDLASRLNAVGLGVNKTAVKWRDYWNEKKYAVRKKASRIQLHAIGTGGGPPNKMALTPLEERIVAILGKVSVQGESVVQIPFDDILPTSASTPSVPGLQCSPLAISEPPPTPTSTAAFQSSSPGFAPPTPSPPPCSPHTPCVENPTDHRHRGVPQWALDVERQRMATADTQAQALTQMAAAMTRTADAVERTAEAVERTAEAVERTAETVERTAEAVERIYERLGRVELLLEAVFRPE